MNASTNVIPFTQDWIESVKAFNLRLRKGGAGAQHQQAPDGPIPGWLAKTDGSHLYHEYYLATQGPVVRGTYILKHQDFSFSGMTRPVAQFRQPLSEAIVDRSFTSVGFRLLRDAIKRQPLLYSLGIGGFEDPFACFLKAAKWRVYAVPFLFKVLHPGLFLRLAPVLRRNRLAAGLSSLAAATGVGPLLIKAWQHSVGASSHSWTVGQGGFSDFGPWADRLWEEVMSAYEFSAVRNRAVLQQLYPPSDLKFVRLRVARGSSVVGWAVLLDTQMRNNKYFGDLRVGSIVDCLAWPGYEDLVVSSAVGTLAKRGADLVISNQSHSWWVNAMRRCGFTPAATNFVFAASPQLADLLAPLGESSSCFHLNRGDGSGPIHL